MAQQEVNLEQTDFSAGFISDANPLQFPPNATYQEVNFQIEKDGSRRRRQGLKMEQDTNGVLYTPDADFYSEPKVTSKVYSTISPNESVDTSFPVRKKDVVTLTDTRTGNSVGGIIKSFDATQDTLPEIPHLSDWGSATTVDGSEINGNSPFVVTDHITKQAYASVSSVSEWMISLIYGLNTAETHLGVTDAVSLTYYDTATTEQTVDQRDAKLAELLSWSGRMVYGFNSNDDSRGYAIGISALPDPTKAANTQVVDLARCRKGTTVSDVLSTDGAWIYAGDLGKIERIVPFRVGLLVFTQDNIWFLGAPNGYFDPYNFTFDKLSSTRVAGKETVVTVDKSIFFWAESDIFVAYPDENTGFPVLQSVTTNKIEKFYEALVPAAKANARGVYNKKRNEIRWMYSNDPTDFDLETRLRFQNELILNLSNGAWTKNTYAENDSTYLIDFIPDRAADETFENAYVVDSNGDQVTIADQDGDGNVELVYVEFLTEFTLTSSFKYVIRDGTQARLGAIEDTDFLDFKGSVGFPAGADAIGLMQTGWFTFTGTQRKKTPNWLTTTFEATESGYDPNTDTLLTPSGCQLTAYWDYANNDYDAKKHGPYQAYRLNRMYMPETTEWNYGQTFISTKNKVRGRGRTVQFKFETQPGKDCRLYSWGYNGTVLTRV